MGLFDPGIDRHLIADQGEVVIDEVRKHWAATVSAALELFGGVIVLLLAFFVPPQAWWVPGAIGLAITAHASWRMLEQHMDRFVITNMRVFRVHGILSQRIATMPLARILDISVHKPLIGRVFGYGHFVFESAAQEQGLREIRFVGDPDGRGLTIQRVIQQSGLRGAVSQPVSARRIDAARAETARQEADRLEAERLEVERLEAERLEAERWATERADASRREAAASQGDERSVYGAWERLADARRREDERRDDLRRGDQHPTRPIEPFDPDRTSTAPIDLPR
ncbi:PH domain-containing protein [Agromyces sp. MMS24-K17]|uniref:PH domain-containing protein n=1 Tax=Agromyces sp. MMS24-K17 TaxID=3372850 RepID=UPI0037547820